MLYSLLIKVVMLAAVVALVLWIGWPTQRDRVSDSSHPAARASADSDPNRAVSSTPAPAATEAPRSTTASRPVSNKPKLDINRATARELQALPGIGEVLAQRVVAWRGTHGSFRTVEDLVNVEGIGPKRMEQLRPLLMAGLPAPSPPQTPDAAALQERKGL